MAIVQQVAAHSFCVGRFVDACVVRRCCCCSEIGLDVPMVVRSDRHESSDELWSTEREEQTDDAAVAQADDVNGAADVPDEAIVSSTIDS